MTAASCSCPVENIELLTRYGSEDAGVQLDKLGGVGWQSRKASSRTACARWRPSSSASLPQRALSTGAA